MNEGVSNRSRALPMTLLICGTCLVIMPQIYESVVAANALYAAAVHPCLAHPANETIEGIVSGRNGWIGSASMTAGLVGMLIGTLIGCASLARRLPA